MIQTLLTCQKYKLSQWLLTVTLLFSIFSFFGSAGNDQSRLQKTTQTELVFSNFYKQYKRTVSYKKAVELISFFPTFNRDPKSRKYQLFLYNNLTKVKLGGAAKHYYALKPDYLFLRVKKIPKSSDEDIFEIYVG